MNLADELRKLQELHLKGALTDDEFAAAKAQVLDQSRPPAPAAQGGVERHLQTIAQQNEVAQLDREWEIARESFMVTGKHGHRHLPTQAGSLVMGVVIGLFGLFWTAMAFGVTGAMAGHGGFPGGSPGGLAAIFPFFGILFIVVGVGMSLYSFSKATQYADAERQYRTRRAELLTRGPHTPDDEPADSNWG